MSNMQQFTKLVINIARITYKRALFINMETQSQFFIWFGLAVDGCLKSVKLTHDEQGTDIGDEENLYAITIQKFSIHKPAKLSLVGYTTMRPFGIP